MIIRHIELHKWIKLYLINTNACTQNSLLQCHIYVTV